MDSSPAATLWRNPFRFFNELLKQPLWVPIWVFFLVLINIASLGYWRYPMAKVIFIAFMLNSTLMMGMYSRFGFERILGLGHVFWIPLLVYLVPQIPRADGGFQTYLGVLSASITVSLAFDAADVWRYFSNRRGA